PGRATGAVGPPDCLTLKEAAVEAGVAILVSMLSLLAGIVIGSYIQRKQSSKLLASAADQARVLLEDGRRQVETIKREAAVEARDEALRLRQATETEAARLRQEVDAEVRARGEEVKRRE